MNDCAFHLNLSEHADDGPIRRIALDAEAAFQFHRRLPGYAPTPVAALPAMSARLGLAQLLVKDESPRFGLNAFKVLGASFALHRVLAGRTDPDVTFTTATDGNHGRAVAWAARQAGRRAVVFMPGGSVPARVQAIEAEGAAVEVIDGDYDAAVRAAADAASAKGWVLVQDTAWPGYQTIPALIMAGYVTILRELESSLLPPGGPDVDAVFLQAGVGSWPAAATWYLRTRYGRQRPRIVCVEPTAADCVLESARQGRLASSRGDGRTIMAGLNCGTPSSLAWPILLAGVDVFLAIGDRFSRDAVRALYRPAGDDPRIVAGESGAAGLAGLMAIMTSPALVELRAALGLGPSSRVLAFNTEGATDPESFARIVGS